MRKIEQLSEGTEHAYTKVKIQILSLTDATAKHWQVVKLFNLGAPLFKWPISHLKIRLSHETYSINYFLHFSHYLPKCLNVSQNTWPEYKEKWKRGILSFMYV